MTTFADPGAGVLRARIAKARKLADVLVQYGFSAGDAQLMDDGDWALAAKGAGVSVPSQETRALAIDEIQKRSKT